MLRGAAACCLLLFAAATVMLALLQMLLLLLFACLKGEMAVEGGLFMANTSMMKT